jgi:shikimate kinase
MKIYLIGLPGCGKSTLGKQLSRRLGVPFIDLDIALEQREGKPVKDIFKEKGEDYFRKIESDTLRKVSEGLPEFVMATGGGAPVFFDNMEFMNGHGQTLFLDVPAREIANRIMRSNKDERPLLAKLSPDELKDQIEFLRSQRISFYKKATFRISADTILVDDVLLKLQSGID